MRPSAGPWRAIKIREELFGKVLASHPEPEESLEDAVDMSRLYSALARLHHQAHHTDLHQPWS
jgi:hypothetical protein